MSLCRRSCLLFAGAVLLGGHSWFAPRLLAQQHDWNKSYTVAAKPTLHLQTADAHLAIHACGDCHEIRIAVELRNRKLSDFRLLESQSANEVSFELREKPRVGFHVSLHDSSVKVTVETPAELTLDASTADGDVEVHGLQGDLRLHSGDGNIALHDTQGTLRVTSSDGNLTVHNASGSLEARTADGHVTVDGKFTGMVVHSSDGNLDLSLAEGSTLAAASRVDTSDGHVVVRLPKTLAANLDVHTSDGNIRCDLPVTTEHFQSSSGHQLRGSLNGGGTTLAIRSSDGNIEILSL